MRTSRGSDGYPEILELNLMQSLLEALEFDYLISMISLLRGVQVSEILNFYIGEEVTDNALGLSSNFWAV